MHAVVIAEALGWPSANALAAELAGILKGPAKQKGEHID